MTMNFNRILSVALAAVVGGGAAIAHADENVLNLYSSRHYQTDERLYSDFEKATGITINRIEGKGDALIQRIASEGANSPADVLLTVDAGRLWRADQQGLLQPVGSEALAAAIPANVRHPDGHWFGFSRRARILYYNPDKVSAADAPTTYEELADPKYKGLICIRSGSNIYSLSLMSHLIDKHGEEAAEEWAKAVVANFARDPQGGDTDQIRAVAAGECGISVGNTYYYARLAASDKAEDRAVAEKVVPVWPNQNEGGVHMNISGAGIAKNAPNRENAVKFLEYLASKQAQRYFSNGNNEYPVVVGALDNPVLEALGGFVVDPINVAVYGENQPLAQKIYDRAGWK
ncbi:MAG: Fe(3+) ABC transporter substrate-binding protein [Alphaproteobacteria bacterium]|nr:Fe(3+) ABC transporter substrate-binding protein [Alphaproteobacteria bacterium]